MIQRIQSIFLLCTAIVAGLMFFMPAATIVVPGEGVYEFYASSVKMIGKQPEHYMATNWMSLILNILIIALALVTIFARKPKEKSVKPSLLLQLRLCFVNLVFMLGMIILMWLQIRSVANDIHAEWNVNTGFIFPVVGIVLTWLAIRGIIKDITLLKSYDRVR